MGMEMGNIVIVSNSRAELGPLSSVIAALPEAAVVGCDVAGLTPSAAMAKALEEFTRVLSGAKLVVVLGDRYETHAAALAAMYLRVPVAHIHGGETTTGAFDDALRHGISHVAHQSGGLHFVATHDAGLRLMALFNYSEGHVLDRYNIHLVGAPGLDGIPQNSAMRDHKTVLVTFHPETMAPDRGVAACKAMLAAISQTLLGYEIIFCGVNEDPGNADIRAIIKEYLRGHGGTWMPDASHESYIRMMQHAALVIGNSSSIPIECPWVGVPAVNIGKRQDGREFADGIFQDDENISAAIREALAYTGLGADGPIYRGGAAPEIARICREFVK